MFVHGVFFDVALNPLFRGCWQPLDQWGTSFAVRLFSSDDTPTLTNDPNSFAELNNGTYEPFIVTLSSQGGHISPPPPYWSVFGAKFQLAPPAPDNGTVFGWYGGPVDDSEGNTYQIAGGRFDPPILIPPAGMTLTIDELRIYLHDCSYPPPPPPAAIDALAIYFPNTGISLNASAPQIGADWSVVSGAWNGQANIEALSDSGSASINLAVIDTGAGDGVLDTFIQVPFSGGVGFVARLSDAANYWRCYADRATAKIYLDKIVAGVSTTVNSSAASVGGGSLHKIDLVMSGNNLTLTWDNAVSISTGGDSFNETATKHGLYAGIGAAAAVFYYTARP